MQNNFTVEIAINLNHYDSFIVSDIDTLYIDGKPVLEWQNPIESILYYINKNGVENVYFISDSFKNGLMKWIEDENENGNFEYNQIVKELLEL